VGVFTFLNEKTTQINPLYIPLVKGVYDTMYYNEIIQSILSTSNGAITTLNNVHYQNIHKTVKVYAKVRSNDNGALMCKEQMSDLLKSIKSKKCILRPVNSKKLK
tara:strand:- start:66 stop:380 length:315 start_codon:yes stop_codon:yes gene_type:complete